MAEVGLREYVERIIEERHALYQTQFDALEAHIERSLAALIEGKKEAYSKTYLILSGGVDVGCPDSAGDGALAEVGERCRRKK
jgi:hypothetical protein